MVLTFTSSREHTYARALSFLRIRYASAIRMKRTSAAARPSGFLSGWFNSAAERSANGGAWEGGEGRERGRGRGDV